MNENDSERIAGLLESVGLTRTLQVENADVVVINTCCIRENADNKFYGHLGNLKKLKEEDPSKKYGWWLSGAKRSGDDPR